MAEAAWNSCDPERVALAYTEDSEWRNRAEYVRGRDAIREVGGGAGGCGCRWVGTGGCVVHACGASQHTRAPPRPRPHPAPARSQFLRRKWEREQGYRLRKYLWATHDNRIAVCFEYEYHDARWEGGWRRLGGCLRSWRPAPPSPPHHPHALPQHARSLPTPSGQWYRAYGNENWEFDERGLMRKRIASINEAPIAPDQRRIAVPEGQQPRFNTWLGDQGVGGDEFPLGGGAAPAY